MARRGSFSGSGLPQYGTPLSVVHPFDNKMPPQFDPALDDPTLKLTDQQKADLQAQIDDLYHTLQGQRDYLS
jgi:hypothetical protein